MRARSLLGGVVLLVRLSPPGPTEPLLVCASRGASQSQSFASISAGKANSLRQRASPASKKRGEQAGQRVERAKRTRGPRGNELDRQQRRGAWHLSILLSLKAFNKIETPLPVASPESLETRLEASR